MKRSLGSKCVFMGFVAFGWAKDAPAGGLSTVFRAVGSKCSAEAAVHVHSSGSNGRPQAVFDDIKVFHRDAPTDNGILARLENAVKTASISNPHH
jgi:hypothetical protein